MAKEKKDKVKRKRKVERAMIGPFRSYNSSDPFPTHYYAKMHYADAYAFTTGAGGITGSEQVLRLNGTWDPDFTGVGHQPYGRDELAPLYKKYVVDAIDIEIVWTNPSADGMFVAMQLQPPGGTYSLTGQSISALKEQPMTVVRQINNTGDQVVKIKQHCKMYKLIGITKLQYSANTDIYAAGSTADPAATPFLRISAGSTQGNAGDTVRCTVKLVYHTRWYDRAVQAQS